MRKKASILFLTIATTLFSQSLSAQVTLEECKKEAMLNYPLLMKYGLIERSKEFNIANANKSYLPQISLSAQASYQTDVTAIPFDIPGMIPLSKDQYHATLDITQSIWDGGVTKVAKEQIKAQSDVESAQLNVKFYTLNQRLNDIYFGILLLEEQLAQNSIMERELHRNYNDVTNYISSGIANQADLDAVSVEILKNRQSKTAMESSKKAYLNMLSYMVGEEITTIVKPIVPEVTDTTINRPELDLYQKQLILSEINKYNIKTGNMPKFSLFIQGGYGNPGLNMLDGGFSPYAIGGIRIKWNIGKLYTRKSNLNLVKLSQGDIMAQKETFLYNTKLEMTQIDGNIQRIEAQIKDDDEIIRLRGNIKRAAQAKLANGTMSTTDMLQEVTAENIAIQNKILHQIELLSALYKLKNSTNN